MAEIWDYNVVDDSNTARFPEGQAPSTVNNGARQNEGITARAYQDTNGSLLTTGTSSAYTLAPNRTMIAYFQGMTFSAEAHLASAATPTLNVGAQGAATIKWPDGSSLAAGDIPAGAIFTVVHDGTDWQLKTVSLSPATLSGNNSFTGSNTFTDDVTIDTTGSSAILTLQSDLDTGSVSQIIGVGDDAANNATNYGGIDFRAEDNTSGAELGSVVIRAVAAATEADRLIVSKGTYTPNATDGDKGDETLNTAGGVFLNGVEYSRGWTRYTRQATTSGTSASVSSINDTAQELIIDGNLISLSSTSISLQVRVGTGATPATTGYSSSASTSAGTTTSSANSTTEMLVRRIQSAGNYHFTMRGTLIDPSVNLWHFDYLTGKADASATSYGHSRIQLGAGNPLEVVELSPDSGTFTGGDFGVMSR